MKALSIRQPFAELILREMKSIELRSWNTKYRGLFLIHVSKTIQPFQRRYARKFGINIRSLVRGAIVGQATLKDVVMYETEAEFEKSATQHLGMDPPEKLPMYGFVLDDVKRFEEPYHCSGRLNFFEIDMTPELEEMLET